jgi:parallel beta-helix repeat protein
VGLFNINVKYIVFNGLVIDAQRELNEAVLLTTNIGISPQYIRFSDCEIKHALHQGVLGADHSEFINCNIHDNGTNANQDHGMYITGQNNLIERCLIHDNWAYGVHVYNSGSTSVSNNIVRNNRVYNNGTGGQFSAGIILSSGNNNIAYNNLVYGNFGGIQISTGSSTTNSQVYNNTVYANKNWGIHVQSGSSGAIIKNNIIYQNFGGDIVNSGTATIQSNNLSTDPQFVNALANDFRLQSGSPAIDTGVDLSAQAITMDFAGRARPQAQSFDIGAYEY